LIPETAEFVPPIATPSVKFARLTPGPIEVTASIGIKILLAVVNRIVEVPDTAVPAPL